MIWTLQSRILLFSTIFVLACAVRAWGQCGDVRLVSSDIVEGDFFGNEVAASGDVIIVDSISEGAAYVYRRGLTGWIEEVKLFATYGGLPAVLSGGIAVNGDLAALRGIASDEGVSTEVVFVFRHDGIDWNQEAVLFASDWAPNDGFGLQIDISGNVIVVGAQDKDDFGASSGAAYVFSHDGVMWQEEAKLLPPVGAEQDWFGRSVAIDGNVIAIGTPRVDGFGTNSGAVYVYRYDGHGWFHQDTFSPDGTEVDSFFGFSLAADAGGILVGAPGAIGTPTDPGAAYVFRFDGLNWEFEAKLGQSWPRSGVGFGFEVDLLGDRVTALTRAENTVFMFTFNGISWREVLGRIIEGPYAWPGSFGYVSMALTEKFVAVGRPLDGFNPTTGGVYVFAGLGDSDCNNNGLFDDCEIATGSAFDCNANGIPDDCENDCNGNGLDDACDLADGLSIDCNSNGIPDECEDDCNGNGIDDACDIDVGISPDCNRNGIPDDCDIAAVESFDCNGNGIPDRCESDCNENGIEDTCDIVDETSIDTNFNDVPDECERANCPVEFKVIASDGRPDDRFGESVAIDGDVAIIGAPMDDDLGEDAGAAYILRRSGETWFEEARLHASDGVAGARFGVGVSISGDIALIGAGLHGEASVYPGQAYVFRYDAGTGQWNEEAILHPATQWEAGYTLFGYFLANIGDRAIVGSGRQTPEGDSSIVAYVYRYDPALSAWNEEAILPLSRIPYPYVWSPSNALAMSDDLIIGGEPGHVSSPDPNPGTVFVYRYDSAASTWIAEGNLNASDPGPLDTFGRATALSGDVIVVGTPWDDDRGDNSGSAYIYRYEPGAGMWLEEAKLLASDGAADDSFGIAVAIEGDVILVGASRADRSNVDTGLVYRFRFDPETATWIEEGTIKVSFGGEGDQFGWDLAISNGVALVGARFDDNIVAESGAAYFNDGIQTACPGPGDFNADGTVNVTDLLSLLITWGDCPLPCPSDLDGDGLVGVTDLLILLANWG